MNTLQQDIANLLGEAPGGMQQVATSDWATVWRIQTAHGATLAAKVARSGARRTAHLEHRMLEFLGQQTSLPVPRPVASSEDILIMDWLEGGGMQGKAAQRHAGQLIAELHNISAPEFGFAFDTLYAPIDQPNPWSGSWVEFFRNQRLVYMADLALARGRIGPGLRQRIDRLAEQLGDLIAEPEAPSLVHGDLWQGNIIADGERIIGFIDPAIYYGHAEMDLAFATLFGTASPAFFEAYEEIRPLAPGFFEGRRDLYNLWPLLGHVVLFGGGYVGQVEAILARFGV